MTGAMVNRNLLNARDAYRKKKRFIDIQRDQND